MIEEPKSSTLVKDLAEAVSIQAQVANRAWISLTTVALFALVPQASVQNGNTSLPFGIKVDLEWFPLVVFCVLVVLIIFFSSAHAQQMRAQKLAHSVIDSLDTKHHADNIVHPRDLFDMLRMPSLNRVAPLAQLLKGSTPGTSKYSIWRRIVAVSYYILLKLVGLVVFFGLPGAALWHSLDKFSHSGLYRFQFVAGAAITISIVAAVALVQVSLTDFLLISGPIKHLWKTSESHQ